MTPVQTYESMTDAELIEFVAGRLPKILDRVQHKPRCGLCREFIIKELAARPLLEPLEGKPGRA